MEETHKIEARQGNLTALFICSLLFQVAPLFRPGLVCRHFSVKADRNGDCNKYCDRTCHFAILQGTLRPVACRRRSPVPPDGDRVTTFILLFTLLLVSALLWRTVFVRQKERQVIRFGLKELVIAVGIAGVIAGGLFYLLFNTTLRIV